MSGLAAPPDGPVPMEIQQALAFIASYDPKLVEGAQKEVQAREGGALAAAARDGAAPGTSESQRQKKAKWPDPPPVEAVSTLAKMMEDTKKLAAEKKEKKGDRRDSLLSFETLDEEVVPSDLVEAAQSALASGGDVFAVMLEASKSLEAAEEDALGAPSVGPRLAEALQFAADGNCSSTDKAGAQNVVLMAIQDAFVEKQRARDELAVKDFRSLIFENEALAAEHGVELIPQLRTHGAAGAHAPVTNPRSGRLRDAVASIPHVLVAVATTALCEGRDPVEEMSTWIVARQQDKIPDLSELEASKLRSLLLTAASFATEPAAAIKARRTLLNTLANLVDADGEISKKLGPPKTPQTVNPNRAIKSFAANEAEKERRNLDKLHEAHDGVENPLLDPDADAPQVAYRVSIDALQHSKLPKEFAKKPDELLMWRLGEWERTRRPPRRSYAAFRVLSTVSVLAAFLILHSIC